MPTPTTVAPVTPAQLRALAGMHPQRMAAESRPVPTYVRWYTGLRSTQPHAIAAWKVGESGFIEALCGAADGFWVDNNTARVDVARCRECETRAVRFGTKPPAPARPYVARTYHRQT